MVWRKSERDRRDRQSHQPFYVNATDAATRLADFPVEVERHVWRAVRHGLDLDFEESEDAEIDNDCLQTVVCDLAETSDNAVEMRGRLLTIANLIARHMHDHPLRLSGDDAVLGWMGDAHLRDAARRRVARAWEQHLQDGSGTDVTLSEARTYRLLAAKARAIRTIIDNATAAVGAFGIGEPRFRFVSPLTDAMIQDRKRATERALAGRRISDGSRTLDLLQVKAWDRKRRKAETWAKAHGIHQIADSMGFVSVGIHRTLPPEFHRGGDRSPEEAKTFLNGWIARLRAKVWETHGEHTLDSWHADRPSALARKTEIERESGGRFTAKTALAVTALGAEAAAAAPWRWVVMVADKVGRDTMGAMTIEPHRVDGTPHVNGWLRCDRTVADVLIAWLAEQGTSPEIVVEVRDAGGQTLSDYCLGHVFGDEPENEAAREWAAERGIRLVHWIGVSPMLTAWRAIYDADVETITVERARVAKRAMMERRFGDALLAIGAVRARRRQAPALRIAYEETDGIGAPGTGRRRRAVGIVDPSAPWEGLVPLRLEGVAWVAQQDEEKSLSAGVSDPRQGPDQVAAHDPDDPPDPIAWLEAAE